jgi:hypothetical protein
VGRDILELFEAPDDGDLRPVVQQFFAVTDQAQFSTSSADVGPLLDLRPQLEKILENLEAKL